MAQPPGAVIGSSAAGAGDDATPSKPAPAGGEGRRRPVIVDTVLMSVCFCLGMGSVFASVTVASLVVAERVSPGLALMPLALQKFVSSAAAFPGARHKTKRGFALAALAGSVGYCVCGAAVAVIQDPVVSFLVLCLGYCITGVNDVFVQFLRFAAADIAPPSFRPRAISYVVAGGSLAALVGPELANQLAGAVPDSRYAGSYFGAAGLLLAQALITLCIDFTPDAPPAAAEACAEGGAKPGADPGPPEQSLLAIVAKPQFALVASTASVVQLTMISLMQISPLAMKKSMEGFELWQAVRVIQGHILGMYVPSFFTGQLLVSFGKYRVMLAGVLLNIVASFCLLADVSAFWVYWTCLTIIGVGWNWGFVGATSLLTDATETYTKAEKAKATGFNDLCIQVLGAVATGCTGFIGAGLGWAGVVVAAASLLSMQLLVALLLPLYAGRASDG